MHSRLLRSRNFALVPILSLAILVAGGCATKPPKTIDDLDINETPWVGWIANEVIEQNSEKTFSDAEILPFMREIERYLQKNFSATVERIQFRFQRDFEGENSGDSGGILAGWKHNNTFKLHQLPDMPEWYNWAFIPVTVYGPFLALPINEHKESWESLQGWMDEHYGEGSMFTEMQIEARRRSGLIIVLGAMRWTPPRTHLHSIIVIVICRLTC